MQAKIISIKMLRTVINILLILIFFMPFYWMLITSFKTLGQTLKIPPAFLIRDPQWKNYVTAYQAIPFLNMLKNSIIVSISIMFCQCITVIPAAYAFARYRFKGSDFLFGLTLSTMMIPAQLIFLPVFLIFSKFGLINNYASLVLPSATSAFAIFMLRQTFKQVPEELIEAARLDRSSELKIIYKIMLPIALPTVITLALLTFVSSWNDYFWPFIMTTNDKIRTLPVGVGSLRSSETGVPYHVLMAANVILVVPVLISFVLAQKKIIQSFTYMGDK